MSIQNKSNHEYKLSVLLKIRCNDAVGLNIYDFLLVSNSIHMSDTVDLL